MNQLPFLAMFFDAISQEEFRLVVSDLFTMCKKAALPRNRTTVSCLPPRLQSSKVEVVRYSGFRGPLQPLNIYLNQRLKLHHDKCASLLKEPLPSPSFIEIVTPIVLKCHFPETHRIPAKFLKFTNNSSQK